MRAEIISVGTELLLGDIVNTNAQFLSQEMAALGYSVYYQSVVGDNPARLRALVQEAKRRSDVLIFTGGLGPTEDDLTKETIADLFGDTLVLDEKELQRLRDFFKKLGRPMGQNNVKQAMVPQNGHKLDNPNGTAPGAFFRQGNKYAFLMPGPPNEMAPMFTNEVRPILESMQSGTIRSLTLRVFGIGESDLEDRVRTLLEGTNPTAALYAKPGEVHIRITALAGTGENAEVMCEEYAELFRKMLGEAIYSEKDENLETTVVQQLIKNGEEVATAESCTGGLLSERLTSVPGASSVFGFGATTYANDVKHHLLGVRNKTLRRYGAVSSQVAAEMAFGAAKKGLADYGVGITGIAGPDGGTDEKPVGLVYVALAHGRSVYVKKINAGARNRETVRLMATQHALDMLRRVSQGLPIPDAKRFDKKHIADVERQGKPKRRGSSVVRFFLALLLVALVFCIVLGGLYFFQRGGSFGDLRFPSATRLQYGTPEYTKAACKLVANAKVENPSVSGLITVPGADLEEYVTITRDSQDTLQVQDGNPGTDGMAALSGGSRLNQTGSNTLMIGGSALAPLESLAQSDSSTVLGTFTYYTERDAKVYEIISVYQMDQAQDQLDGFDPSISNFPNYDQYLTYVLGTQARNLYALKTDLSPSDSYMTLCAVDTQDPDTPLYVCGRLVGQEQASRSVEVQPASSPLMPTQWYKQNGLTAPTIDEVTSYWLRWYLDKDVSNTVLQLSTGMPEQDIAPTVKPKPASNDTNEDPAEEAAQPEPEETETPEEEPEVPAEEAPSEDTGEITAATRLSFTQGKYGADEPPASSTDADIDPADQEEEPDEDETGEEEPPPVQAPAPSSSQNSSSRASRTDINRRPDPYYLTVTMNGQLVRDSTTSILAQICQREVGDTHPEVIKAQAIAAHTWILNQQGSGNEAPIVVGEAPTAIVLNAVEEVAQQVLSADSNTPAFTPWYRMAANATNTPGSLWGGSRIYLESVNSAYEQGLGDWREIKTISKGKVANMIQASIGIDLNEVEDPGNWFSSPEKNSGGYVTSLKVGGVQMNGSTFWRQVLVYEGSPVLKSPAFEIEWTGEDFVFTTYGEGHGCGLSQVGALGMANDGKSHPEILAHYYPSTKLINWE